MATIKLTDGFGLVINASPSPSSIFSKYLKSPSAIVGALHDLKDIKDLQVGQDPFQSQSVGLSFDDSIGLGTSGVQLTIDPELLGTIAIKKGDSLFDAQATRLVTRSRFLQIRRTFLQHWKQNSMWGSAEAQAIYNSASLPERMWSSQIINCSH